MRRESRLLVSLVVISTLGVIGLMVVASQYRKSLARVDARSRVTTDASVRAIRLVDGYLAARRAAQGIERGNAFTAHGMSYEDYAAVRAAWRTYRSGGRVDDPALVAAFRARRGELEAAGLGPEEPLDDAIK